MKTMKRVVRSLLVMALCCAALVVTAFAETEPAVWTELTGADGNTAAQIISDAAVTDGVLELTYDSSKLTYQNVTPDEAHVAMISVNAEEEGIVRISWVAPDRGQAVEEGALLMQVNFTGKASAKDVELGGSANDANGNAVTVISTAKQNSDSVKTGDDSQLGLYMGLLLGAAVLGGVVIATAKRRNAR